jgi:hypothetical protein
VELIFGVFDDSPVSSPTAKNEGSTSILAEDKDAFDKLLDSQSSFWDEVDARKVR